MFRHTLLLSQLILLLTLHGCAGLRLLLISDTQLTPEDTYIEKELLPILENLNIDFLLISGGLIENPNPDPTSQISNLIQKFRILGKNIFWVPSQDEIGAPQNVTNFDKNIHKMVVQPIPGLFFVGYGGNYTPEEIQNFYQSQTFSGTNPSVILLTYYGPAGYGFDTTKIRVNSANDGTTGVSNLTEFLTTIQPNDILFLHGANPQGIGSSNFGQTRIINPGGVRDFNCFSILDLILNGNQKWELSDWKNYRYGNVTSWGGVTTTETCKQVTTTVAAPWSPTAYTVAALVLFSIFLVVYIVGFGVFVNVGKAE